MLDRSFDSVPRKKFQCAVNVIDDGCGTICEVTTPDMFMEGLLAHWNDRIWQLSQLPPSKSESLTPQTPGPHTSFLYRTGCNGEHIR